MDMTAAYSEDLRRRVIAAVAGGLSTRKAAWRFSVGISTVGTWTRRWRATGETAPRKQGKRPGSKLDAHEAFILELVEETPDISLAEIGDQLAAEHGVRACPATICQFFKKRGMTYKKRRRMRASNGTPM